MGLPTRTTAFEFWKIQNLNQKELSLLVYDLLLLKKKWLRSGQEKWLRNTPDQPQTSQLCELFYLDLFLHQ